MIENKATDHECPTCGAEPGRPCKSSGNRLLPGSASHRTREEEAVLLRADVGRFLGRRIATSRGKEGTVLAVTLSSSGARRRPEVRVRVRWDGGRISWISGERFRRCRVAS